MVRAARGRESGFGIVELAVAMGIFAVAVMGLAGSMAASLKYVGSSRQRSVASAVATEKMERIHNFSDAQLALLQTPTHDADPESPDFDVTDGTPPTYDTGPTVEPLIVDTVNGGVLHIEDPVEVASSSMRIHQYVTRSDQDGDGAFEADEPKRITIVVWWYRAQNPPVASRIVMSSLVGDQSVSVPQVTPAPTATPGPPSPSPTAGPTPTPGNCDPGDTQPPTGTSETILSGNGAQTGYTNSLSAVVRVQATDPCAPITARLSNSSDDSTFVDAGTITTGVQQTFTWMLPSVDGTKVVYARFRDGLGNTTSSLQASIVLDQTDPTVPGDLRTAVCGISGADRSVTLTWNASSDANLNGYHVYRSLDADPFTLLTTTASTQVSDTTQKSKLVRYLVRAFDLAANESGDSNVLTFPKNEC